VVLNLRFVSGIPHLRVGISGGDEGFVVVAGVFDDDVDVPVLDRDV